MPSHTPSRPPRRFRRRALPLALAAVLAGPASAAPSGATFLGGVQDPAITQAYLGSATPDKLAAALAGLQALRQQLALILPPPCWACGTSGSTITWNPGSPLLPPMFTWPVGIGWLIAGSDAELGAAGNPVDLSFTRLQLTGSFVTARDFIIGSPAFGHDHWPDNTFVVTPELKIIAPIDEVALLLPEELPSAVLAPVRAASRVSSGRGGPGWIDTAGHDLTISGRLTSHQTLYKEGEGTLHLTGANVWHARPVVRAGVLQGNTLSLATDIANDARVRFDQAEDGHYAHVISGHGGLDKTGSGMLTLTGVQTYTGTTRLQQGGLALAADARLDPGTFVELAAGTLFDLTATRQASRLSGLAGDGTVALGDQALIIGHAQDAPSTFAGAITGNGRVVIAYGRGAQRFTGHNSYRGGTEIAAWNARLEIGSDHALGAPQGEVLMRGGTLAVLAPLTTARTLRIDGLAHLDHMGHDITLLTGIEGTGQFGKTGAGTLFITTATPFSGRVQVSAGTLALRGAGALNPASEVELTHDGVFDLSAADGARQVRAVSGSGTGGIRLGRNDLILSGGAGSFEGVISGQAGLTVDGAQQTLLGANTFAGPTRVLAGTLRARPHSLSAEVINHGRLELFDLGEADSISAYSGNITGTGMLVKTGTSVIWLRGHNRYSGGTRIEAGVLMGNTDSLYGEIETRAGLAFYQVADGTHAHRISGSGSVLSFGPGALTLLGDNTHRGGTAISNTLRIRQDAALGAPESALLIAGGRLQALDHLHVQRRVVLGAAGGGIDTQGYQVRLSGPIDGPGGLIKLGSGVLHLAGSHAYAGPTQVSAGGLVVAGDLAGDLRVEHGAWLKMVGELGGSLALEQGAQLLMEGTPGALEVAGDFIARGELHFRIGAADSWQALIQVGKVADLTGATLFISVLDPAHAALLPGLTLLSAGSGVLGWERASYRFGAGLEGYRIALHGNDLSLMAAPVPEPATWAMLLAGLGLLAYPVARRRRAV